jgi:hypothetical protein
MKYFCILLLILFFTNSSCDKAIIGKTVYRIMIKNNTNGALSFALSYNYPDTIPYKEMLVYTIDANDFGTKDNSKKWDKVIDEDIPGKKLQIFVFSVSKISPEWNWDSVITKYQVLKRYELTSQQLKDMNYTVSYP